MSGGTKFDTGKADLALLPPAALNGAARVFSFGEKKYGRFNFTKGFTASRLISAALRHLTAWAWGEDNDPESGESHLYHALCCIMMLVQIRELGTLTDDRFKPQDDAPIPTLLPIDIIAKDTLTRAKSFANLESELKTLKGE